MKTKYICSVLILLGGLFGCSNQPAQPVDESYAVYSTVLKNIQYSPNNGNPVILFVINETTDVDKVTQRPLKDVLRNLNPPLPYKDVDEIIRETIYKQKPPLPAEYKQAIEDFKSNNNEARQITRSFDLPQNYVIISRDNFWAVMSGKNPTDNWQSFYNKYPDSSGFITFSRVGFDAEKKHAIVYFEQSCGSLCAGGSYILLEKDVGIWKETGRQDMWAS